MSIGYALLGVLASGPAHGYDLKHEHDQRFPGAKPLAYGQVYSSLGRLERDGLVEVVETSQAGGPERTVYALTAAGQQALTEWLTSPEPAGPYPADELVRKTVTALHVGRDAADFLGRQREAHLARMRELVGVQAGLKEPEARIAIDHTIYHLDADLRWLETATARVAAERVGQR
jgi:DNA-binding PadR family transcriptional regulator